MFDSILDFGNIPQGSINESGKVEVIIKFSGDIRRVSEELGIEIEILGSNYAIATLLPEQINLLVNFPEIEHIEMPKTLSFNLRDELRTSCITGVHNPENFGLTGRGALVAILDSGIDYTHRDFRNEDGTTRVLYIWDQTALGGTPPEGFSHGSEYSFEQINEALGSRFPLDIVPQEDYVGHGTAVAGVAAGNGISSNGENKGVAPEASIIAVKLGERGQPYFARTTEFMRALKYVSDKAIALNMPLAINISYGTNEGAHTGETIFEAFINYIADRWKTSIVVASGNEGAAGHHYMGSICTGETQDISFFYAGVRPAFYLVFLKNFVDKFTLELILPSGRSTGIIYGNTDARTYNIDGVNIFINYGQPKFYTAGQEVFFKFSDSSGGLPQGIWTLRVHSLNSVVGSFNMYLPTTEEVTAGTAFTHPTATGTITIPATANKVIAVGGYNSHLGTAAIFSGRGLETIPQYIKPDLVAPAVNILAPKSRGGYGVFSGTSIAAPFVTGSAALMMQWGIVQGNDPFIYGERIKAFLRSGANRSMSINYPNTTWGYGTLCLLNTMRELAF